MGHHRTWALVLAAGDGTRLAALTTDANGRAVPKQFCSLTGGRSLLRDAMQTGMARNALDELYQRLPIVDFSRAIVQGSESRLRVITAPACGWTDLGTPERVAQTLQRLDHAQFTVARVCA
jgi:hypothetical protein